MHPRSRFTNRLEDQASAKAAKAALIAKMAAAKLAMKGSSGAVFQGTTQPTQLTPVAPEPSKERQSTEGTAPVPTSLRFGTAQVPVLKDGDVETSTASHALGWLVDQYLETATSRKRQIAVLWPTAPKSLMLVHALATLERWTDGDKMGIRGMTFPVKTNVFYPLNHMRFSRAPLLRLALQFAETSPNPKVKRSCRAKDPYLSAFNSALKDLADPRWSNPTLGELLPHFLVTPTKPEWESCEPRLLSQLCAKLQKRSQATALRTNCSTIGHPATAPDAMFALDGRMSTTELRKALLSLKKLGAPEVVVVNATRTTRRESRGWKGALARFCLQLEAVFGADAPGVLIVADEPHAAYRLREELFSQNAKRPASDRWQVGHEYVIVGMPCAVKSDGLMPHGTLEVRVPAPREVDTEIVDAEAAKIVGRLNRVANAAEGGRDTARPITEAMAYLNRIAALPCGVRDLSQWLTQVEADDRSRQRWAWPNFYAPLLAFSRTGQAGEQQNTLTGAVEAATKLVTNYDGGTPFAHLLARHIGAAVQKHKQVVVVMSSNFHKHLALRFLSKYRDFQDGRTFEEFEQRVTFICSPQLEDALDTIGRAPLVFAGLDEESLRLLITDDRIPSHSTLLLTQQNGQYLRAAMKPLVEHFPAFRPLKPRMESILRGLAHLPEAPGLLTNTDLVMPTFRIELSHETSDAYDAEKDPEAWTVVLEDGRLHRRPSHRVYVYDPASREASDRGFRSCEIRALQPGDRLFVMSGELRDLVEGVFKEAGIPLETDKVFEAALRNYHRQVNTLLERAFPEGHLIEKVRALRRQILEAHPKWKDEFPEEQAVRHWVNLGQAADTAFDQLRPQAPLKEAHFSAFAKALGMSDFEAAANWQRVIMPIRNARRQDGRHLSEIYTHMLLQPESVMVHSKISRLTIQMLYGRARESLCVVEALIPNKEEAIRA
ncbi:hypothetical protein [Polaromonas sp. C04]|uniref:hypothetical protein n=1 Tax=Polaromonas sp. C04 TaxID=1945857 RepID=UPI0009C8184D|nr:hypothetical protein [Polaromonas sp. C04]OOG58071.1 hypothetical protein B0E49_04375 [Polaromonas sp. C04]